MMYCIYTYLYSQVPAAVLHYRGCFRQEPFHCEVEHQVGMSCLSSGPVICRLKLDRGGYVPGESIGIWASVNNRSKVTIKRTTASLTEVRYRTSGD